MTTWWGSPQRASGPARLGAHAQGPTHVQRTITSTSRTMTSQATDAHNGGAPASRTPEPGNTPDQTISETAEPLPANPVSNKKIEANRHNARQSTGPKTDAGKPASQIGRNIKRWRAQVRATQEGNTP